MDVGKNIGAELQTDQAEADKRIAQAKAEERRALAVAMEQEYKAEAQKQRAFVIAAEAQIPLAMAEAFRNGNLGVMDYQRYRNVQADTAMREAIAGQSDSTSTPGPDRGFRRPAGAGCRLAAVQSARARAGRIGVPTARRTAGAAAAPNLQTAARSIAGDATQREGSRLEQFLRELERNLEQAARGQTAVAGQASCAALPDDEDVEERDSLERAGAGREPGDGGRAARAGQLRPGLGRGGAGAPADRGRGGAERAAHQGRPRTFDTRIRQEPADHTAVRRYTPAQLRDAIVWREILGPPVSERDP